MILISVLICEKKQRLEVARGFTVFTSQFYLLHTIPTQPVDYDHSNRTLRIAGLPPSSTSPASAISLAAPQFGAPVPLRLRAEPRFPSGNYGPNARSELHAAR
eukprot:COSAG02_NODE_2003_length_10135_cov_9.873754_4_plen_103_part_00